MTYADKDDRGRPRMHKPLTEEWGPLEDVTSLEDALKLLVEHERHMKKRFIVGMSSPIEARNARIKRERFIATVVRMYTREHGGEEIDTTMRPDIRKPLRRAPRRKVPELAR